MYLSVLTNLQLRLVQVCKNILEEWILKVIVALQEIHKVKQTGRQLVFYLHKFHDFMRNKVILPAGFASCYGSAMQPAVSGQASPLPLEAKN